MSKFKNSKESVSSNLMLWSDLSTQVGIKETYDMKIWPVNSVFNDGPISFNIPQQAKALLEDIIIVTKLRLKKNGLLLDQRQKSGFNCL